MSMMGMHLTRPEWAVWAATPPRLAAAAAITVAFALLGRLVRGVTASGAVAGGIICFLLFSCAGPGAFWTLFALFVVTWIATRLGRARKQRLGTAERREGRKASQVLANLGVAAGCAVLYAFRAEWIWLVAMVAAMSEAAADTVSSECGQALGHEARLITTLQRVPAGTDGGISVVGTAFGILAAIVVAAVAVRALMVPVRLALLVTVTGVAGMFVDSVLGASLERRRWLNNDAVNLAGTFVAAAFALGIIRLIA
jgi:uncharacterized protein (TIGR00297 family)